VQDTSTVCVTEEDVKSRGTTPSRRSPRLARDNISTIAGYKGVQEKNTICVTEEDGKSRGTAFVVSPTPSKPSAVKKVSTLCGGKTKYTAIPISPALPEPTPLNIAAKPSDPSINTSDGDGKTRSSAITLDPSVNEAKSSKSTISKNMCRSIVVSPRALTRVSSANVLDERLRIRGRGRRMNSKVKIRQTRRGLMCIENKHSIQLAQS
jgi:hypothetical protein